MDERGAATVNNDASAVWTVVTVVQHGVVVVVVSVVGRQKWWWSSLDANKITLATAYHPTRLLIYRPYIPPSSLLLAKLGLVGTQQRVPRAVVVLASGAVVGYSGVVECKREVWWSSATWWS